jgi:hypothetical protein
MSIPIENTGIRSIQHFQLSTTSFSDFENNNFEEFFHRNILEFGIVNIPSKAIFHISLSPYQNILIVIFRHKFGKKVVYQYRLSYPVSFVRAFEAKVMELDSLGEAIAFFKGRNELRIFEKYLL